MLCVFVGLFAATFFYVRITKLNILTLLPINSRKIVDTSVKPCSLIKYEEDTSKSLGCDYDRKIDFKVVKVNVRAVRILDVFSVGNDRYMNIERQILSKWVKEKIYIGNVKDNTKVAFIISSKDVEMVSPDWSKTSLLSIDNLYTNLSEYKGTEVLIFLEDNKRKADFLSTDYVLGMVVVYKQ